MSLRVYYEDTDLSGVVYHANYLRFMERGRTEFFRLAGIWLARLHEPEPVAWTLRKAEIHFHRPARIDDPLEVHSRFADMTGARIVADQKIMSRDGLLVEGRIEACLITLSGKVRRIPPEVRDRLAPFLSETET
ncbi:MAG: YbgC/FadM family acyl-CoA thioesterase [Alphaproteobacteria bacterium]|nr:YbgC/FadM family acyl-CoA thioesterase [Alphaproteobacteria bacterium]MBV9694663.1 YbgC/FadM family acyl-CoA thioesterase [Alphaproteobacteria bacterium]